ncbi:MAG: alpha/beta hydrolase family protein [Spirochaetaceae bacterium]
MIRRCCGTRGIRVVVIALWVFLVLLFVGCSGETEAPPETAEDEAAEREDSEAPAEQQEESEEAPGSIVSSERVERWSPEDIAEAGPDLFGSYDVPNTELAVEEYLVYYRTTDFDGTPVEAKAQLFIPVLTGAETPERPVLVFGSGTTGVANRCAPSLEQEGEGRWGYYRTNMAFYASRGFITIFPDYIGFNDSERVQRYFSKAAEAHLLLDGARAVSAFLEEKESLDAVAGDEVFTAGYSQGGHAALAAADLRSEYAPEVPLQGAIGFASTNDVATLMREAAYYAPYIIYAYRAMYGEEEIRPSRYLKEEWAATLDEDVENKCVKELEVYYPFEGRELFTEEFYEALHGGRLAEEFPAFHRRLEENRSGLSGHDVPVLLVQGGNDVIITPEAIERYMEQLCDTGVPVTYRYYDDARHRHTRPAGFEASVGWMASILEGDEPPNECEAP